MVIMAVKACLSAFFEVAFVKHGNVWERQSKVDMGRPGGMPWELDFVPCTTVMG